MNQFDSSDPIDTGGVGLIDKAMNIAAKPAAAAKESRSSAAQRPPSPKPVAGGSAGPSRLTSLRPTPVDPAARRGPPRARQPAETVGPEVQAHWTMKIQGPDPLGGLDAAATETLGAGPQPTIANPPDGTVTRALAETRPDGGGDPAVPTPAPPAAPAA